MSLFSVVVPEALGVGLGATRWNNHDSIFPWFTQSVLIQNKQYKNMYRHCQVLVQELRSSFFNITWIVDKFALVCGDGLLLWHALS